MVNPSVGTRWECNQYSKIAEYWSERGYDVEVDLVDAGFVPAMRSARTDVRSNMVNGMPRRKLVNVNEVRSEYRPD